MILPDCFFLASDTAIQDAANIANPNTGVNNRVCLNLEKNLLTSLTGVSFKAESM